MQLSCSKTKLTTTYGGKLGTLPKPTRVGYTFPGWYTKKSGEITCTRCGGSGETTSYGSTANYSGRSGSTSYSYSSMSTSGKKYPKGHQHLTHQSISSSLPSMKAIISSGDLSLYR